jgi:hypothetical protein
VHLLIVGHQTKEEEIQVIVEVLLAIEVEEDHRVVYQIEVELVVDVARSKDLLIQ